MSDNQVFVPSLPSGIAIDNVTITTGAGLVYRQRTLIGPNAAQLTPAVINNSVGGNITLVAGSTGLATKLYRLLLVVGGATNLTFQDQSTPLSGAIPCGQYGGITLDFSGEPWYTGSVGNDFIINSSNAVQVSGTAWYVKS